MSLKSQLLARFILQLPESEYRDRNRLLYNVLQAQWYRERFLNRQQQAAEKRRTGIWQDAAALCKFGRWLMGPDEFKYTQREAADFFRNYYYQIPVCGAIIYRDATKKEWLTVRSPYSKRQGFPKGKVNHQESDKDCACREVHEETGLDIRPFLKDETPFIEYREKKGRHVKFFLVILPADAKQVEFRSENSLEISSVQWMPAIQVDARHEYVEDSRRALELLATTTSGGVG